MSGFIETSAAQVCLLVLQAAVPFVRKCICQFVSDVAVVVVSISPDMFNTACSLKTDSFDLAQQSYDAVEASAFKAARFLKTASIDLAQQSYDAAEASAFKACKFIGSTASAIYHWSSSVVSLIFNNATVVPLIVLALLQLVMGCIPQGIFRTLTFWPRFYWNIFGPSSSGRSDLEILFKSNPGQHEPKSSRRGVDSESEKSGICNYTETIFKSAEENITSIVSSSVKDAMNFLDVIQCSVWLISSRIAGHINEPFATTIVHLNSFHDAGRGCFTMMHHHLRAS